MLDVVGHVAPTFQCGSKTDIFRFSSSLLRCWSFKESYSWRENEVREKFSYLFEDIFQPSGEWCAAIDPQGKDIAYAHRRYIHFVVYYTREAVVQLQWMECDMLPRFGTVGILRDRGTHTLQISISCDCSCCQYRLVSPRRHIFAIGARKAANTQCA